MTENQVMQMYDKALKSILKENKRFLKTYNDVMTGKMKPPEYYVMTGTEAKWREGFLRQKMRQEALIENVQAKIDEIGGVVVSTIKHDNNNAFVETYGKYAGAIKEKCAGYGIRANFAQYSQEQVNALIDDQTPIFTKIAYNNIGHNTGAVRKLKSELAQSIMTGESQEELIKRLRKVVGYTTAQAWRTAQTERTRVQNFAEDNIGEQCRQQGIVIEWEWVCHFLPSIPKRRGTGSRDSHKDLHGKKVLQGQSWKTINGYELRYPCDPTAPAIETINCHCSRIQRILTPDEAKMAGIDPVAYKNGAIVQKYVPKQWGNKTNSIPVAPVDPYEAAKLKDGGVTDFVSDEDKQKVNDIVAQKLALDSSLSDLANLHTYDGIWYNKSVTPADYSTLKSKIQAKKDYYNNQLLYVTDQAKIDEFSNHISDLLEFQKYGKEYEKIAAELKAKNDELVQLQREIALKQGKKIVDDPYSQTRKDSALWAKSAKQADDQLRYYVGQQWKNASYEERNSTYKYTYSFHPYNEPLRGIQYGSNAYKGVGKTDLNRGGAGADINRMTAFIDKCQIPVDMWAQRGCGYGGMDKFLGVSQSILQSQSQKDIENALMGKVVTEYGFMSAGCSKGQGFSGNIIMNIYAPKGTKAAYAQPFSAYGNGQGVNWDGIAKQKTFGHQDEIIFQQGTMLKITKVQVSRGTIFLDLDVIGTEKPQLW